MTRFTLRVLLLAALNATHAAASESRAERPEEASSGAATIRDCPTTDDAAADCAPEDTPSRKGTHFIAEGALGAPSFSVAGYSFGGLIGLGGKLPGFPPRLYLFGETLWLTEQESSGDGVAGGSFNDVALGLRLYLPLFQPIRIFGEGAIGATYDNTIAQEAERWRSLAAVAGGIQARVLHEVSVGTRVRLAFNDPSPDGDNTHHRTAWLVTLSAHF